MIHANDRKTNVLVLLLPFTAAVNETRHFVQLQHRGTEDASHHEGVFN